MMAPVMVREITDAQYTTFTSSDDAQMVDTLELHVDGGDTLHVPNTDFTIDNPALCTLAYLGARPSEVEEAVGEHIPVAVAPGGDLVVAEMVVSTGQQVLKRAPWCPADGVDDD